MNALGVGPKDVGLLPRRAVAGRGEGVAVGEPLLKSEDVRPFIPDLAVLRKLRG